METFIILIFKAEKAYGELSLSHTISAINLCIIERDHPCDEHYKSVYKREKEKVVSSVLVYHGHI